MIAYKCLIVIASDFLPREVLGNKIVIWIIMDGDGVDESHVLLSRVVFAKEISHEIVFKIQCIMFSFNKTPVFLLRL